MIWFSRWAQYLPFWYRYRKLFKSHLFKLTYWAWLELSSNGLQFGIAKPRWPFWMPQEKLWQLDVDFSDGWVYTQRY